MTPAQAVIGIVVLLLVSGLAGALLGRRRGSVRRVTGDEHVSPSELGAGTVGEPRFGTSGTVVQFSTAYCARCPGVRRALTGLTSTRPGLAFVEVDLTHAPELAKRFRVLQTPTLLLLDREGSTRLRLSGQLSHSTLSTALDELSEG